MNGTAITDAAYSGWVSHSQAVVSSTHTRQVISDAATTFSASNSSSLDGWYNLCQNMIDSRSGATLATTCVVIRVYYDYCASDFQVTESYSSSTYQYIITASTLSITVPAWTSGKCNTWGRALIGVGAPSADIGDSGYPFASISDQRYDELIPPYSRLSDISGNYVISINTASYSYMGSYQLKVVLYDGGDGSYSNGWTFKQDTEEITVNVVDGRACTPDFAISVSANVPVDHVNGGWDYVYTMGSTNDLVITWTKTGGNCQVSSSVLMNGAAISTSFYSPWVTHTEAQFSLTAHTLYKYDLVSSASTTFSLTDAAENESIDGTYVVTFSQSESTSGTQSSLTKTVRVIWDTCTPNMSLSSSLQASYDYQITASTAAVTLPTFTSGNCESDAEFFIESVALGSSPYSFFSEDDSFGSWGYASRSFTLTAPYTVIGSTTTGTWKMSWQTDDYTLAGAYAITIRYYTVQYSSSTGSPYE